MVRFSTLWLKGKQFLFDYNPVVEIDPDDSAGQLLEILDNIDHYRPLIERNERTVREHHTWSHRWEEIRRQLGLSEGET